MANADISIKGILELLNNLKPGKAAGQEKLRPLLLKELRVELAQIVNVLFYLKDLYRQASSLQTDTEQM